MPMQEPILVMTRFDHLELFDTGSDRGLAWKADVWAGTDLHRLWIKTEGEQSDGGPHEWDLQALYSRAILPFWDLQGGIRRELGDAGGRNWGVVAIRGIAPYHFDTEAELFVGDGGDAALRVHSSYDLLLTQAWIVEPRIELKVSGYDDPIEGIGPGLSRADLSVRLRYEVRRELAPYFGINWTRYFGATKDYERSLGNDGNELAIVAGVRVWF
jgi:copper resistance protein B